MTVFVDGHVHLYPNFSLGDAFDSAWNNFSQAAVSNTGESAAGFVMLLVDAGHLAVFDELSSGETTRSIGQWQVLTTDETNSLILRHPDKGDLTLIAGRQWVTKEDIEILSLFDNQPIKSRKLTTEQLVETIVENGGLPLLTWGVGKWTGHRGSVVEQEIHRQCLQLLVGDNGNRPHFWSFPSLLEQAVKRDIKLISGSDPLTLTNHQHRIGTRGSFSKNLALDMAKPASQLKNAFMDSDTIFTEFGAPRPTHNFILEQVQMQWNKQMRRFR